MNHSDRRALLILFFLFIGVWSAILIYDHFIDESASYDATDATVIDSIESQLHAPTLNTGNRYGSFNRHDASSSSYFAQPTREIETFPFDPNTADSTTLLHLGLPAWMVRNIYKYRAKGGRYHEPDDFKRTYGMTGELWKRLGPMIRIGEDYRLLSYEKGNSNRSDSATHDTLHTNNQLRYPEKFKEQVKLDLNTVDTTTLRRIPGIGPVYARHIVRYREQLGGFVSLSQLTEIPDLPEGIGDWFEMPSGPTRIIRVNTADFNTLRRHPYMSYEKAAAIANHRRIRGPIADIGQLKLMPEFTETDLKRLEPYLDFSQ